MTQTTTLYLTLKQPYSTKDLHSILSTVLSSPYGDADLHIYGGEVRIKWRGQTSSALESLYETLKQQTSLLHIMLSSSCNGLSDAD